MADCPYQSTVFAYLRPDVGGLAEPDLCVIGLDLSFATQIELSRPPPEGHSTFDKPHHHP